MRLNLDVLTAWLPEQWHTKRLGTNVRGLAFMRPLLYEPGISVVAGNLYLTHTEALPESPPDVPCCFFCVGRRLPSAWLSAELSIVQFLDGISLPTVYNRTQEIFDYFDDWDSSLRDELEKDTDFDIRQILMLGASFLHRPINVVDSNLQQLFHADYDSQSGASIREQIGPMPMAHSEQIKEVCTLERTIREPYQSALEMDGRSYCNNLYISNQFCGCISISEFEKTFQPWEYTVMAHFFSCFQKAYFKYLSSGCKKESISLAALRKALGGRILSDEEKQQLSLTPEESWLCFELQAQRNERAFPYDYMYAMLNVALPKTAYTVVYHERLVGLIRVSRQNPYAEAPLAPFSDIVSRMGYCAGISNAFSSLSQVRDYLRQATYVLGRETTHFIPIRFFRDCALSYMLDSCVGEQPLEGLLSRGLDALMDHDRQKGSEYIRTLDLYLQNETSISKTAEALFVHRSSLLKRLDKIYRILGNTLDTPDERLYLRLCMELLRKEKRDTG